MAVFVVYPLFERSPSKAYRDLADQQAWLWSYLSNWHDGLTGEMRFQKPPWLLDHFWTLAVEEQFYLVWPLAIFLLRRRWLMSVCVATVLGALALRVGLTARGAPYLAAYTLTPCRVDALAVGALLALIVRQPYGRVLVRWAPAVALVSGAGLVGIFVWGQGFLQSDPVVQTAGYSLLAIFFGSLLLQALAAPPGSFLFHLTRLRSLRWLGKYSYGLYVFHGLMLILLHRWANYFLPVGGRNGSNPWVSLLVRELAGFGLSIALALLSWHLYEKHFLKLKRFFENRKEKRKESPVDSRPPSVKVVATPRRP